MKKNVTNVIIIVLLSFAITLYFAGFKDSVEAYLLNILYGAIIGLSFAFGSSAIARYIFSKADLVNKPLRTYTILLAAVILFMSINVIVVNYLWFKITQDKSLVELLNSPFGSKILISEIIIGLLVFLVIVSFSFIKRFRDSQKEVIQAKQDAAKFQYETLKNQINPHFLFNSLNVLSALIHIDKEKADKYTNMLAQVYRYILDHQDDELVSLKDDIEFVEKYGYLLNIRFDENFTIDFKDVSTKPNYMIVPMSIQLLIENVFKHNVVSQEYPMQVEIKIKEDYLVVSNTINKKNKVEFSHGLGLKNIEQRYSLLTDRPCLFGIENERYFAKIPLLELEH